MKLISQLESLENIIIKHRSLLEKESKNLLAEFSLSSSKNIKDEIQKIEDENRLLQIGIVGRVKAGKSSLLNALLFEGKSILPKAATPMTAALTIISYGHKLSAEVEFFKKDDIDFIKIKYEDYINEFEDIKKKRHEELIQRLEKKKDKELEGANKNLLEKGRDALNNTELGKKVNSSEAGKKLAKSTISDKENKELLEKAEKYAHKEMKNNVELSASYDQYTRIIKSGLDYTKLENSKLISFDSLEVLGDELGEYVGSNGKYMPFTKSVHIKIPQDNLKNIQIVDTPGINDPVVSREERTRELLKYCDVVFIVSPAGQFMSNEDLELMDRITTKEGIRELFVVASKCDTQLYGSIKDESKGDLHKALNLITTDLSSSLYESLSNLKKTNPEIGNVYDTLIQESKNSIIHSSGISLTIKELYDNQDLLDSNEEHAWNLLLKNYPDYFSKTDKKLTIPNLDMLANISIMNEKLTNIRNKKDEIMSKRRDEFIDAKTKSFLKYKEDLLSYIEQQKDKITHSNIDELQEKRQEIKHIKLNVSAIVDEEYYDLVDELKVDISSELHTNLKKHFKETRKDIENAEGNKTDSWTEKEGGFLGFFQHTVHKSNTYTTVRAGVVKDSLIDLTIEVESSIEDCSLKYISTWRKKLTQGLLSVLRENVDDKDLNPTQIRKVIRNVISNVKFPELSYTNPLEEDNNAKITQNHFFNIFSQKSILRSATGTLEGNKAENFIDEARGYVSSLKTRVNKDINLYISDLISTLKDLKISSEIFSEYDAQLEELEIQIKNKNITLDEFDRAKKAIRGIN